MRARMLCLCVLFLLCQGIHGNGPTDFVNVFVGTGKRPTPARVAKREYVKHIFPLIGGNVLEFVTTADWNAVTFALCL